MTPRKKDVENPVKLLRSGVFALNRKKWAKARRKFEAALSHEEMQQNAGVWANYGIALVNLKLFTEAQKAFSQAVSLDRKNSELWVKKGLTEHQLENFNDAQKSFEKAMRFDKKDDPEIPILLSRTLRKKDDLKKAVKILESAQKKFPTSHQIPIELALIWDSQNEEKKVLQVLKRAISTANHPDPGLLLGQSFLDQKEFKQAILVYEELLSRFPESQHAQYGLGVAHHANNEWQKALDAYQTALPLFRPGKPPQTLFINMARVYKNLDRKKEAIDTLYQAKKYGKTTLEIILLLAELFVEIERPDRAKRALEDGILIDKENPVIHFYLGLTLLQLKDVAQAKEKFQRTLDLDPSFHESKLQLALLAIQEKDFQSAYKLANDVAQADPTNIPGQKLTAKLAFDLHNFRRTIEILQPLVKKEPDNLEDLELLLRSWLLLSQPEKAQNFIDSLLHEQKDLKHQLRSKSFFAQFL
ncbi:MAG: tetratricopeptide repeat protein [Candidatus Heimdallarchaeota archaeon]|nr:MAG: tetratricopeptide repeat protein [Candidatus Heimdallarchaeota archaeon]